MSKFSIYFILGAILCLVGCVLVHEKMNRSENAPKPTSIPSVAGHILPTGEITTLQVNAREGDCDAAHRLGLHHFFVTLQFDEATIWFRMAAKCSNIRYKESLVAALLMQKNEPKVATEIDNTILDMKKIDPEDIGTKRVEAEVFRRRQIAVVPQ